MNPILEIFYNDLLYEASKGTIKCLFDYNIVFDTIIEGRKVTLVPENLNYLLIPTLNIKNKALFDDLLISYTKLAIEFYKEDDEENNELFIKKVMALLWRDATSEDFNNPCLYLQKRIAFLTDKTLLDTPEDPINTSIGHLNISCHKEKIWNETPYYLEFDINSYPLPLVKCAVYNNNAYIYAIQNTKLPRNKQLNRAMYKVNEGINIIEEENDNILNPENITGITPATLISALLAIAFLKSKGIGKIIIPTLLYERWNAKAFLVGNDSNFNIEEPEKENEMIQRNLSDKFIRTFRRLEYVFTNINITSLPFDSGEGIILKVDDAMGCNNPLLEELYNCLNPIEKTR